MEPTVADRFLASYGLRWDPNMEQFELLHVQNINWSVHDLGCMHGAFLVERIRTFGKRLVDLPPHIERLKRGCEVLGLESSKFFRYLEASIQELLKTSLPLLNDVADASLCIVVSPGDFYRGSSLRAAIHWLPIPWKQLGYWMENGTTLVRVQYASGAGECWPSNIKARSRLNYFLADRDAKKRHENSLGLLCTSRGMVSDTSMANILVVDYQGRVFSPRPEDTLCGTSLHFVEELLREQGRSIEYRDIHYEELLEAAEVLLVGNTGCLWQASHLNRRRLGTTTQGTEAKGSLCASLQQAWINAIGFDWKQQAIELGKNA